MKHKIQLNGAVWLALVTGCLALFAQSPAVNVGPDGDSNLSSVHQYRDPIAYCQAVGTIGKPDGRYSGPKLPVWMARDLNLKPRQGDMMEWRCANGAVMACVYGANIPCDSKANTSQTPTQAVTNYCKHNKNSSFVPKYVTGHESAVSWACHDATPVVIGVDPTDPQGYSSSYWHKVEP
jgi:hypothetical protein